MNRRSHFSGFGSAEANHRLFLQGQRIAKAQREKKSAQPTSMKDPRFVSIREQIERNASKISGS